MTQTLALRTVRADSSQRVERRLAWWFHDHPIPFPISRSVRASAHAFRPDQRPSRHWHYEVEPDAPPVCRTRYLGLLELPLRVGAERRLYPVQLQSAAAHWSSSLAGRGKEQSPGS